MPARSPWSSPTAEERASETIQTGIRPHLFLHNEGPVRIGWLFYIFPIGEYQILSTTITSRYHDRFRRKTCLRCHRDDPCGDRGRKGHQRWNTRTGLLSHLCQEVRNGEDHTRDDQGEHGVPHQGLRFLHREQGRQVPRLHHPRSSAPR